MADSNKCAYIILFILIALGIISYVCASQFHLNEHPSKACEDVRAWYDLIDSAPDISAEAMYHIGVMSEKGIYTHRNISEAENWYMRSAGNEYDVAQYKIGMQYFDRNNAFTDKETALEFLWKAADNGHAEAQYWLGVIYETDNIRYSDRAFGYYKSAADQGNAEAQYATGRMYESGLGESGLGVQKNMKEAIRWHKKAAEQNILEAQYRLLYLALDGEYDINFTDMHVSPDRFIYDASHGDSEAQLFLGYIYENTARDESDTAWAAHWYNESAAQGNIYAMKRLADIYIKNGNDIEAAIELYKTVATYGDLESQIKLGDIYKAGEIVDRDLKEAFRWYTLAADHWYTSATDQRLAHALVMLGEIYERGVIVEQDLQVASELYMRAAIQKDVSAERHMGDMRFRAIGVEKDIREAKFWYKKAAIKGDPDAQFYLGYIDWFNKDQMKDGFDWINKAANNGSVLGQLFLAIWGYDIFNIFNHSADGSESENGLLVITMMLEMMDSLPLVYAPDKEKADQILEIYMAQTKFMFAALQTDPMQLAALLTDPMQSYNYASSWSLKAAEQGSDMAMYLQGLLAIHNPTGVTNWALAQDWFQKAADNGNEYAQKALKEMYKNGNAIEMNYSELQSSFW